MKAIFITHDGKTVYTWETELNVYPSFLMYKISRFYHGGMHGNFEAWIIKDKKVSYYAKGRDATKDKFYIPGFHYPVQLMTID